MSLKRLREQAGYTIIELMMVCSIGAIVVMASAAVLDGSVRRNDGLQRRSVALQQGRHAMDEVVRSLRSQVCFRPSEVLIQPPVVAANATSVTFYADFGDASGVPDKHVITLQSDGRLTDTVYKGSGTQQAMTVASTGKPRLLGENLAQEPGVPMFQFYGFNTANPPTPVTPLNSYSAPTVASADVHRIARVVVTMRANPEGRVDGRKLTSTLRDEVFVRLADPNDAAPLPKCA